MGKSSTTTRNPFKIMYKGTSAQKKDGMHRPEGAGNFDNMDDNVLSDLSGQEGQPFVKKTGDTMSGDLNMGSRNISNIRDIAVDTISTDVNFGTQKITGTGTLAWSGIGHDQFSDFVANEHIDWTGSADGLDVTIADGANKLCMILTQNDVTNNPRGFRVNQNTTGDAFIIDQNSTGKCGLFDHDWTNTNNSDNGVAVQFDATVTDASTYTKSGSALSISSGVTETSGTITDSSKVLALAQNNTSNTGNCLDIGTTSTGNAIDVDNNGTGQAIHTQQDGTLASSKRGVDIRQNSDLSSSSTNAMLVYSNVAHSSNNALVRLWNDHTDATNDVLFINCDSKASAIFIDHDDTGNDATIDVDRDGNSSSDIYGLKIASDNGGSGVGGGIDLSSFSVDEPLIKAPNDAITSLGTLTKQIAVNIAGTIYYLPAYTTGS